MKSFRMVLFSGLVLFMLLYIGACDQKETNLVARIGARKITVAKFESEFGRGKSTEIVRKASLQEKKDFLNQLIDRELKIIDAYQNKLHKDKTIIEPLQERERDIIFNRLIEREVIQNVIPESELREYYDKASKEVKIKQILVKFDPQKAEQKQRAFRRAKDIVQKLKSNEDFARLVEEVSDDVNTAKKGGDFGYLKWGPKSSQNPVYVAAFSMKANEISDPIETENGYYIIKVVQIKNYPSPPFEREKEKIRRQVYSIRNKDLSDAYFSYLNGLRKKYNLKFNEENLELFVKKSVTPADSANQEAQVRAADFENFTLAEGKLELSSFSSGRMTINDLVNDLKKIPPHRRPPLKSKIEVQDFMNNRMIPIFLLEKEAKSKHIENDSEVQKQIKDFRENVMINNIQRIQVNEQVTINDADLKAYFEEHREEYKNPETRSVQQIVVKDKKLAEEIIKKARRGENFSALFRRYNQNESIKKDEGKAEISRGRAGIGKPAFSINAGEVTDPIAIGDGFYIVKVLAINAPTLQSFEEAKNMVTSKFRRLAFEKREKAWLEALRSHLNFVIYEHNLDKAGKNYIGDDMVSIE